MNDTLPFADFRQAAAAVLALLRSRLPFDLWMVTRREGDHWIVLQTEDHGYDLATRGALFRWADSFCSLMVEDKAPRVAPQSDRIPAYAGRPIAQQVNIGAYIGVPLARPDGSLFGTLCAIHPSPQPDEIRKEQQLVEMLSRLLSTVLAKELAAQEEVRRVERAQAKSFRDEQTQLYNRHGWSNLLAAEQARATRYGHPAAVVVVALAPQETPEKTSEAARTVADVLRTACAESDIVARTGALNFAALLVESSLERAQGVAADIIQRLASAAVGAFVDLSEGPPVRELRQAWAIAEDGATLRRGGLNQAPPAPRQ